MSTRKKILFVGGYGRSGSTLLDRILGHSSPALFSGGEIRHVFKEGYGENRLCGCGTPFLECPFWTAVSRRALGGDGSLDVDRALARKERVDRWWLIPRLATPRWHNRSWGRDLAEHQQLLSKLYDAMLAESGCEVIVDSTKDPSHGYVLATMDDVDLYVIHLVRDSRAVAHSWQRKKFNPGSGVDMDRYSLLKTGVEWDVINGLIGGLKHRSAGYTVVHYEDFISDPASALDKVFAMIGVDPDLPVDGRLTLTDDHTVAGNPIRFKRGETQLSLDDEWRRSMAVPGKVAMTSLTLPALARYGFKVSW
jgi:hypothetical protein